MSKGNMMFMRWMRTHTDLVIQIQGWSTNMTVGMIGSSSRKLRSTTSFAPQMGIALGGWSWPWMFKKLRFHQFHRRGPRRRRQVATVMVLGLINQTKQGGKISIGVALLQRLWFQLCWILVSENFDILVWLIINFMISHVIELFHQIIWCLCMEQFELRRVEVGILLYHQLSLLQYWVTGCSSCGNGPC